MTHSEQDKMHQVSRYAVADLGGGAGRAFSVFYFYWVNICVTNYYVCSWLPVCLILKHIVQTTNTSKVKGSDGHCQGVGRQLCPLATSETEQTVQGPIFLTVVVVFIYWILDIMDLLEWSPEVRYNVIYMTDGCRWAICCLFVCW